MSQGHVDDLSHVSLPEDQIHLSDKDEDDDSEGGGTHLEIDAQGDVNIQLGESDSFEEDFILDEKMSEALLRLVKGEVNESTEAESKLNLLEEKVKKLSEVMSLVNSHDLNTSQRKRLNLSYLHCVREAIKLRSEVILTEGKTQERLERRMANIIKEIKNMSKPNRRNIFDFLFEAGDEKEQLEGLEEAELSLELTDE